MQTFKLWRFTFGKRKNGKMFWAFDNNELLWPHVILWRLFWHPFVYVSLLLSATMILIQRGPEAAKEFWSQVL